MQKVTVTFDFLFDVCRLPGFLGASRRTEFSFTCGDVTRKGVMVQGWPPLRVGHTVTALLRKAGDWSSLIGWFNHNTGEVTFPRPDRGFRHLVLPIFAGWLLVALVHFVFTVNAVTLSRGATNLLLLMWGCYGALVLLLALFVTVRKARLRRDVRTLEQLQSESRPSAEAALEPAMPAPAAAPEAAVSG